jgi:hypothetical protein
VRAQHEWFYVQHAQALPTEQSTGITMTQRITEQVRTVCVIACGDRVRARSCGRATTRCASSSRSRTTRGRWACRCVLCDCAKVIAHVVVQFDVDSNHELCFPFVYDFCVGKAETTFIVVEPGSRRVVIAAPQCVRACCLISSTPRSRSRGHRAAVNSRAHAQVLGGCLRRCACCDHRRVGDGRAA